MTLVEILIACFILLLFMGACYSLLTRGFRTMRTGDTSTSMLSEVRTTMNFLTRELREGEELLYPLPSDISGSHNIYTSKVVSILKATNPVSYILDEGTGTVQKAIYNPINILSEDDWNPTRWTLQSSRVIGKNMESLVFWWETRIPVQDGVTGPSAADLLAPQVVGYRLKARDDPEHPGSGMEIWSTVRMRF